MFSTRRRSSTTIITGLMLASLASAFPLTIPSTAKDCEIAGQVIPNCDLVAYLKKINVTAEATVSGSISNDNKDDFNLTAIVDSLSKYNDTKKADLDSASSFNLSAIVDDLSKYNDTKKPDFDSGSDNHTHEYNSTEKSGDDDKDGGLFKTPDYSSTKEGDHFSFSSYSSTGKPTYTLSFSKLSTDTPTFTTSIPRLETSFSKPSISTPTFTVSIPSFETSISKLPISTISIPKPSISTPSFTTSISHPTVPSLTTSFVRITTTTSVPASTTTPASKSSSNDQNVNVGASFSGSGSASIGKNHNRKRSLLSNLLSTWTNLSNELTSTSLPQLQAAVKTYASASTSTNLSKVQSMLDSVKASLMNLGFAAPGAGLSASQKGSINSTMVSVMAQLSGNTTVASTHAAEVAELKTEITTIQGLLAKVQVSA